MNTGALVAQLESVESSIFRGAITAVRDSFQFVVCVRQGGREHLVDADLVVTTNTPPDLRPGDRILCCTDSDNPGKVLILGRIGAPAEPAEPEPSRPPDELVIEAGKSLTLRVGDGSITIREDGRILIKGRELVSHAKGMNRIRGGSVAVN